MTSELDRETTLFLTARIVNSYMDRNKLHSSQLAPLISEVGKTFSDLMAPAKPVIPTPVKAKRAYVRKVKPVLEAVVINAAINAATNTVSTPDDNWRKLV